MENHEKLYEIIRKRFERIPYSEMRDKKRSGMTGDYRNTLGGTALRNAVGYLVAFGLLLLFISDNVYACRRLENMGFTDWWKYQ